MKIDPHYPRQTDSPESAEDFSDEQIVHKFAGWVTSNLDFKAGTLLLNVNPLTGTLEPQSNGPLYSNTAIGTLAVVKRL